MIAIQQSERNGPVIGAVLVEPTDELMLISTAGVLIRTRVDQIRVLGRATQGVTLINLDPGSLLAGIERVVEADDPAGALVSLGQSATGDMSGDTVESDAGAAGSVPGADGEPDAKSGPDTDASGS